MFVLSFILIFTALFSFLFSLIPLSLWWLFLWVPLSFALTLGLVALFMVVFLKNFKKFGFTHPFVKFICPRLASFVLILFGIRVITEDKENLTDVDNVLFVPNHKSNIDPILLYKALKRPCCFASKSELWNNKLFAFLADSVGLLKIDRENDRTSIKEILRGIKMLKANVPMCVFPEGGIKTREVEQMVSLKAGAYKLATKSNAYVQPICIYNNSKIDKKKGIFPILKIYVKVLPVIKPEDYEGLTTHELGYKVIEMVNSHYEKEERYVITEED